MLLSTQTHKFNEHYDLKTSIKFLKEAGFDAYDLSLFLQNAKEEVIFSDNYLEKAKALREYADSLGIVCNQSHAVFPSSVGDEKRDEEIFNEILRDMEVASILGAKAIVVHPIHHLKYAEQPEKLYEINLEFYKKLIPYCEKLGIKVATENMWERNPISHNIYRGFNSRASEFARFLDEINSEWIVGCADVGHVALVGADLPDFIKTLGRKRLQALHIHDVTKTEDSHTLPFTLSLDFGAITKALGEIDYKGDMTFEADNFFAKFPLELYPQASAFMAEVGRYLIKEIEKNR